MSFVFLSDETIKRLNRFGLLFVGILSVVVLILLGWAWYEFPGAYDFVDSYISELGQTVTDDGFSNGYVSAIYCWAMFFLGISSIGFWYFSANVLHHAYQNKWKYITHIGSLAGIIGSIAIAGTGYFHLDTHRDIHYTLGALYFGLVGLAMFLYAIFFIVIFFKDKNEEKMTIYSAISLAIPILFAFVIYAIIEQLSAIYIIILAALFVGLNVLFQFAFKSFINYMSYLVSFSILVLEVTIILLLASAGLLAIIETTFVLGIISFSMINNTRVFALDY